jgi:hypothetical protein
LVGCWLGVDGWMLVVAGWLGVGGCWLLVGGALLLIHPHLCVYRQLPTRYYSEPNGAAILLGRVDLRVDHGHFGNHMNIQESPRADNSVRLSRIGTGRHGGRSSHE